MTAAPLAKKMASTFSSIGRKIFGSKNDREVKRLRPHVDEINSLEPEFEKLSDDELGFFGTRAGEGEATKTGHRALEYLQTAARATRLTGPARSGGRRAPRTAGAAVRHGAWNREAE